MLNKGLVFFFLLLNSISAYAFLPELTLNPAQKFHHVAQTTQSYKIGDLKNLKDITTAFNSADPDVDDADLATFDSLIGDATVVGLGEGTHGTREFFQMKHRLLKYLVKHKGFNIFAIEGSMAQASLLNDYVLYGKGDPKELLKNLEGWVYNTQEVLSMINWMHDYNQNAQVKVQFAAFDFQDPNPTVLNQLIQNAFKIIDNEKGAAEINQVAAGIKENWERWRKFIRDDLLIANKYEELTEELKKKNLPPDELNRLAAILETQESTEHQELASQYVPAIKNSSVILNASMANIINEIKTSASDLKIKLGKAQYEWVLQGAYLMQQNIQLLMVLDDDGGIFHSFIVRDKAMAENIFWLQDHNPESKIVVWAHNGHINNVDFEISGDQAGNTIFRYMGRHLKLKLGDRYRPIGFLTYEGKYTALKAKGGVGEFNLQVPPDNTLEAIVNKLEVPFAFINLKDKDNLPVFLRQPISLRFIGAIASAMQFAPYQDVSTAFDGMVYIKTTSASQAVS